jgi:hypothetical protein
LAGAGEGADQKPQRGAIDVVSHSEVGKISRVLLSTVSRQWSWSAGGNLYSRIMPGQRITGFLDCSSNALPIISII